MNTSASSTNNWNSQLYESNHAFVWQFGENLIDLLSPQENEQILDLGCGTGQLTAKIAQSGAKVTGIDRSETMIVAAKQNYPTLEFLVADARDLQIDSRFDAVFSNATLHWIQPPEAAIQSIHRVLKPGGRFVAEFGGKGNIQTIVQTLEQFLPTLPATIEPHPQTRNPWYFPSISEYANLLESYGFEVRYAVLFDRPTPLTGELGMVNWLHMFAHSWIQSLLPDQQQTLVRSIAEQLRPKLYRDGIWIADYRRIRIIAVKTL